MTRARKELVAVESTPFYHCIVRCVRRAYLCGNDPQTGKNYDHRKQWTVERLQQLASVFAIDVCAYAIMSNHYHVVLHINDQKAKNWSNKEVAQRWTSIFKGPTFITEWINDIPLDDEESTILDTLLPVWRKRLTDISWFMRCMNETIARQANKEDNCSGRFWEGRFKSQALLDETALLACMTYVDLNPIRANIAKNSESSDFTSIQSRLFDHLNSLSNRSKKTNQVKNKIQRRLNKQRTAMKHKNKEKSTTPFPNANLPKAPLLNFEGEAQSKQEPCIPFSFVDYLQLVEETGRVIRNDKKGFIDENTPPLLDRLGIQADRWATSIKKYGSMFSVVSGNKASMDRHKQAADKKWVKGALQAFS